MNADCKCEFCRKPLGMTIRVLPNSNSVIWLCMDCGGNLMSAITVKRGEVLPEKRRMR